MIWRQWSLNRTGNSATVFLTNVPRGETGSNRSDQTEYRAKLRLIGEILGIPETIPVAPPYVPRNWPRCLKACIGRNGYHVRACPESSEYRWAEEQKEQG